jgi:hypothetical protein
VTTEVARQALEGILAAGWYDRRFGDLGTAAASVLAAVLRLYVVEGHPPSAREIAAAAGISEADAARSVADLRRHDLVILAPDGATIRGAYPFTQATTVHAVTFVSYGHTLNSMCAIDALGAGAMCRADTVIRSRCHLCARGCAPAIGRRVGGVPSVPRLRGRYAVHGTRLLLLR